MRVVPTLTLVGIFILNWLVGIHLGFGVDRYWFFESLHFLGGFFVAMFLVSFRKSVKFVFGGLALVTFFWELAEYVIDKIPPVASYLKLRLELSSVRPIIGDTIFDIILNFAGALLFWFFLNRKTR